MHELCISHLWIKHGFVTICEPKHPPKKYLLFCKVLKMFNESSHWLWYSWLDNSIPLLSFYRVFCQTKCSDKQVQFLWRTAGYYYSWAKSGIFPSRVSPPTQPVWHKEADWGGKQRKRKKWSSLIRVFSMLFVAALVSWFLWRDVTY